MDNNEEVWKDIPNCEEYQVSNKGRVKSFKGKKPRILKACPNSSGYPSVSICSNGSEKRQTVHRLVMISFYGESELPHINHINGVKTDNRLENLEYCSAKENVCHAFKMGLAARAVGEDHGHSKLSSEDVFIIKNEMKNHTIKEICEIFNISSGNASKIRNNKIWKHI
jgi:hypothetical protein